MFKLIAAAFFTFILSISSVHAGPSKKIFAGNYDGITELQNVTGARIFYSPVRMKISQKGIITGTAYRSESGKIFKVTGKIGKVKSLFGIRFIGKATGTFSDGTKWSADVEAMKGAKEKIIKGKGKKGGFTGTVSLTNL